MENQKSRVTFNFDPYENIKIIPNLEEEIVIITKHKIQSILQKYDSLLKKRDAWITPFSLLITLITIFVTADFRSFIFPSDTWRAFFLMLTLASLAWFLKALYELRRCKDIDDILKDFLNENVSITLKAAPRVVATYPRNREVIKVPKDGLNLMFSVTYNQRMAGGYSWCTTKLQYPENIQNEQPSWTDEGKTCNLRMRIYANQKYGISFNIEGRYENFRSIDSVPAEPYFLEFETVEDASAIQPSTA